MICMYCKSISDGPLCAICEERFAEGPPRPAPVETLADRFIADPRPMAYESPYRGWQTVGDDDAAEIVFPDGSVAHTSDGVWRVGLLPTKGEHP